jgi:hypothetical protein
MTGYLLSAGTAILISAAATASGEASTVCGADAASAASTPPYVALRRLEARTERNGKFAWMDVRTTLSAAGRLTYEILAEGGSTQIRDRALVAALKREQESLAKGIPVHVPSHLAGYECADASPDGDGLVRVALLPRQPNRQLVNAMLTLEPASGRLVRVAGQLARNPSFWVSDVQVEWHYLRIGDAVLPEAVHARAKVKFVGPSTFDMTYRYVSVDGHPVKPAAVMAGGGGGRQ